MAGSLTAMRIAKAPSVVLLCGVIVLSGGWTAAATAADWPYQWPTLAPVIDGFRAPPSPFAAGNRGLEFGTSPGSAVLAAAAGRVLFAGEVGGAIWVTIVHLDGVRTSYGRLATRRVSRGAVVRRGQTIGTAGSRLHVSARIAAAYVDPAVLFGSSSGVHLVPTRPISAAVDSVRSVPARVGAGPAPATLFGGANAGAAPAAICRCH